MKMTLDTGEIVSVLAQYAVNKLGKEEFYYAPHISITGVGDKIVAIIDIGEPTGKKKPYQRCNHNISGKMGYQKIECTREAGHEGHHSSTDDEKS